METKEEGRRRLRELANEGVISGEGVKDVKEAWTSLKDLIPVVTSGGSSLKSAITKLQEGLGSDNATLKTIGDYNFFDLFVLQTYAKAETARLLFEAIDTSKGGSIKIKKAASELHTCASALTQTFNGAEVTNEVGGTQRLFALEKLGRKVGEVNLERSEPVIDPEQFPN